MENFIAFFNALESKPLIRLAFLVAPITLLWMLESARPLRNLTYQKNKGKHALLNFTFTIFHLIIHALLATLLVLGADWCQQHQFGLVYWLNLNVGATIVVGVLAMDFFGGWLVHWVEHKVPLFWRIHIVHHADNKIDVTSGLRHHPLEALNRWVFFMVGIFLSGIPVYAIMIGQTFMSMFTMLTHANIQLPAWFEKPLSWIFISPNAHKVHHHYKQPYTDSNYGTAFSIWDRLLGTYRHLPTSEIQYGLDKHYDNSEDENFKALLKSPFKQLEK